MQEYFKQYKIIQFYSAAGTPTDNPRVERSHLTDENEYYSKNGNRSKPLGEAKTSMVTWEHHYNFVRPHQALSYLSPMEFYHLWKDNPDQAYKIVSKWKKYHKKQSKRQWENRRIKKKGKIEELMKHIDSVLKQEYPAASY